jgi:peptide/nickel transport system permease protein
MAIVTEASSVLSKRSGVQYWWYWIVRLFLKKPLGAIGMVLVLLLCFLALLAPVLAPEGYNAIGQLPRLQASGPGYLMGTDELGRSVLTRVIWGARLSMFVGIVATAASTIISLTFGMTSAYIGGKFDLIFQRFIDGYTCFPDLPLLIMLMAVLGPGMLQILLVLGVNAGIQGTRGSRALIFMIKENQYIRASEAIGARTWWVMWKHLLPNLAPLIIVGFTMGMGGVILAEAGLSFLGLGLPDPFPSWGKMISGPGRSFMVIAPWMLLYPGLALAVAIFGINIFGDALRDLMDPRLRGGLGGYGLGYRMARMEKGREKLMKMQKKASITAPKTGDTKN